MKKILLVLLILFYIFTVACGEKNKEKPQRDDKMSREEIIIDVNKENEISPLSEGLFSTFVEQLGRQVYGGIYQPSHMTSDNDGFRKDVIDLVKELGTKYVRYPGGNFVSGYNWKDGIGKTRTPKIDTTANQLDPNTIGVDEFMKWADKVGMEVMMAVNLGNGTAESAGELVEYCNATSGKWAEERKSNGHAEPYGIKYWCLGNEMDGDWQIGHCNAYEYAERANEAAEKMKKADPDIKLIYCGSSSPGSATFRSWDRTVIANCYDNIDCLSIHSYFSYNRTDNEMGKFLSSATVLDGYITTIRDIIEEEKEKHENKRDVKISLDEWNIWYSDEGNDWSQGKDVVGPKRCENVFSSLDATVVGSLLSVIINNADIIDIACMAQLVNVIAPIMVDPNGDAIRQTIFYPYKHVIDSAKGKAYKTQVKVTPLNSTDYSTIPSATVSVTYDESTKEGMILVCNLSGIQRRVILEANGFGKVTPYKLITMNGNTNVKNTLAKPNQAVPKTIDLNVDQKVSVGPYSWNVIKFKSL